MTSKNKGENEKRKSKLSEATEKRIDELPKHAQHIFIKAHDNAIEYYKDPDKRKGGKNESREQVAQKVAWGAVKKGYKKKDDEWVKKK